MGTVNLVSHSRNLILRSKTVPRLGDDVFDNHLNRVGVVNDVFGPVDQPYISVTGKRDDSTVLVGKPLYLVESKRKSDWKWMDGREGID